MKTKRRNICLLLLMIVGVFAFGSNVYADDATCVYNIGKANPPTTYTVHLNENQNPTVTLANMPTMGLGIDPKNNDFVAVNFQDSATATWKCPSKLYFSVTTGGRAVTYSNFTTSATYKSSVDLNVSDSKDGGKLSSSADEILNCKYGSLQLSVNKTKKTITGSSANCKNPTFNFSVSQISSSCPASVYLSSTAYGCSYSLTKEFGTHEIKLNGDDPVIDAGGNPVAPTTQPTTTTAAPEKIPDGYCPLGPDVTKDLAGVLKIIRIAAPILVIGLSTFEAIKAITKGDANADMKKVATRFGKRVVFAIILFFITILVDQFMQLLGIWDEQGGCKLTDLDQEYFEPEPSSCYKCNGMDYELQTDVTASRYFWGPETYAKNRCNNNYSVISSKTQDTCK